MIETEHEADLDKIRKWAESRPNRSRVTFADPSCWLCGKPTVEYVNITAAAAASVSSTWKPACEEHAPGPIDFEHQGKKYVLELLGEIKTSNQRLAEELDKALECLMSEFASGKSGPAGLRAQAIAHVRQARLILGSKSASEK